MGEKFTTGVNCVQQATAVKYHHLLHTRLKTLNVFYSSRRRLNSHDQKYKITLNRINAYFLFLNIAFEALIFYCLILARNTRSIIV